jgi:hypothetical protein
MRMHRSQLMIALTAPARWVNSHFWRRHHRRPRPALSVYGRLRLGLQRRWRPGPDPAGVREPRRPRPTLPVASVALAEPRTTLVRRIRLRSDRPAPRETA